jgi:glycine dehydrogenase subunit 1
MPPAEINRRLAERGIVGGLDLGRYDVALDRQMLFCATELNDRASIERLIEVLRSA